MNKILLLALVVLVSCQLQVDESSNDSLSEINESQFEFNNEEYITAVTFLNLVATDSLDQVPELINPIVDVQYLSFDWLQNILADYPIPPKKEVKIHVDQTEKPTIKYYVFPFKRISAGDTTTQMEIEIGFNRSMGPGIVMLKLNDLGNHFNPNLD